MESMVCLIFGLFMHHNQKTIEPTPVVMFRLDISCWGVQTKEEDILPLCINIRSLYKINLYHIPGQQRNICVHT